MDLRDLKLAKLSITIIAVAAFSGTWYVLAGHLTAWSDEIAHLSVASGLRATGEPFSVVFDQCAAVTSSQYVRGLEISRWTSWSYDLFGESLRSARVVPFVFTIATWALYVVYTTWKGYSSVKQIAIVSLLFFGQSMVLEKALYVRVYAPLLFFLLVSLIALWEASNFWRQKKFPIAMGFVLVVILSLGFTRGWHLLHFAIFVLAVILLWLRVYERPVTETLRHWWQRLMVSPPGWRTLILAILVISALGTITAGPRAVDLLGTHLLNSPTGFSFGRSYLSPVQLIPWDNIGGLLRFLLVTNVLLFIWWRRPSAQDSQMDFNSWLLAVGVISGITIAFLMNHNFVFWSRFFYLSVGLVVLGASPMVSSITNGRTVAGLLVAYVAINGAVSASTFHFDRSNVGDAITWLQNNSKSNDLILSFDAQLSLHGGDSLCERTLTIRNITTENPDQANQGKQDSFYFQRVSGYPYITGDGINEILSDNPDSDVYFIYTDHHGFRGDLYRWTTTKNRRNENNLFQLLKSDAVGDDVMSGLRGAGLKKIDRVKLTEALAVSTFP